MRSKYDKIEKVKLLSIRSNMMTRCYNPNASRYYCYGGRGITVCDEWRKSSEAFVQWGLDMGFKLGLSLERIDVDGNYTPENCTFIPLEDQAKNKRSTIRVTYYGCTKTLKDWCRELKLDYRCIYSRLAYGKWDVKRAFETPIKHHDKLPIQASYTYKGITDSLRQLCKRFNKSYNTVRYKVMKGQSVEDALNTTTKKYRYKYRRSTLAGGTLHER